MSTSQSFSRFKLNQNILTALAELGYETPTPIQEQGIPVILSGEDLLAQAQTGTGKTATFALPVLSMVDYNLKAPQALILAPTRELAIQVAEAFQSYAKHIKGFSVAPIYGGQDFNTQLRLLKRGSQVLVCTPGRLMDHMRRGSLLVDHIKTIVLDEADEMLKMGFVDDVEWILSQMTMPHQTALFSATMPASIHKISQKYLKDAKKIHIKQQTNVVETIEQSYVQVSRNQKLDMLTRILEAEDTQGVIIFARTKNDTAELSERLQARGYAAAALNGDMSQSAREKAVERLKQGKLDILVATDVAARGIDVERVTHVINYDIPYDVDSYIHRIGRTGRAGREGRAILFVTPREQRLFRDIEHHIKKSINRMTPPSLKDIREKRLSQLKEKVVGIVQEGGQSFTQSLEDIALFTAELGLNANQIAAALILLNQEDISTVEFTDNDFKDSFSKPDNNRRRERRSGFGFRGQRSDDKPRKSFKRKDGQLDRKKSGFSDKNKKDNGFERKKKDAQPEKRAGGSDFKLNKKRTDKKKSFKSTDRK